MASLSLSCSEPKCSYYGSFKTTWELRRHRLNQHPSSQQTLQCCAIGCSISSQHAKFTRPDKLTSHIRALHRSRSLFWCPHQDCGKKSLKGLEMFVHIQSHGSFCNPESGPLLKAVANAVSPAFPRCEMCQRSVPLHKLIEHLHDDHEGDTSDWNTQVLGAMDLLYAPSWGMEAITINSSSVSAFMCIFVSCPMCSALRATHVDFAFHLVELHMHKDAQHFGIWLAHVAETLITHGYAPLDQARNNTIGGLLQSAIVWKPWRFALMSSHTVSFRLRCPECKTSENIDSNTMAAHHLSMLDCSHELYLHRENILALCPQFASHPVFQDLHVAGQVSEPHVVRLQQTSNTKTKENSLSRCCNDFPEIRQHTSDATDWVSPTAFCEPDIRSSRRYDDCSGVMNHVGGQFYDPMIGGREIVEVDMLDMLSASSSSDVLSASSTAHHADVETAQPAPPSRTTCQVYKEFSCKHPHCDLRFERQRDLRLHRRAHVEADKRPYGCATCGKRFMYPKDLKRHGKIHEKSAHPPPPPQLAVEYG
jgi:hypothetical protein